MAAGWRKLDFLTRVRIRELVLMGLIAEHTGQPVEKVTQDALRDRWFTAEQAVEYGFVDRVVTDLGWLRRTPAPLAFGGPR